jgi:hypothetical protein
MSVQLEIFPQNYLGYSGEFNPPSVEIVANPNFLIADNTFNGTGNFNSYLSLYAFTVANGALGTIEQTFNNIPTLTGAGVWFVFKNNGSGAGTTAYPVQTVGNLFFKTSGGTNNNRKLSGIIQRLDGLTPGNSYTITVKTLDTFTIGGVPTNNKMWISVFNGTGINGWAGAASWGAPITAAPLGANADASPPLANTTYTKQFTAQTTNDIVVLTFQQDNNFGILVDSVSIEWDDGDEIISLTNGAAICDLYEEEDIPLSLSVDDFKNVAEKVQSYSKAFKLPATKRNSKIFDNIFEITRSSQSNLTFNPYIKTKCILKEDGFVIFEGYLRLIDIVDKNEEISYNVNLYSEAVALADILAEKTFNDLIFQELEHSYTITNILYSWNPGPPTAPAAPIGPPGITYINANTSGFRDDYNTIKYPFVDWRHDFQIISSGYANAGSPQLPRLESAFRPFIQIKYLIDRIFAATPFRYTSDFFDTADFKKLYMDFNWGADDLVAAENTYWASYQDDSMVPPLNQGTGAYIPLKLIDNTQTGGKTDSFVPPGYSNSTHIITATQANELYTIHYNYKLRNTSGSGNSVECRWLVNGVVNDYIGVGISATQTYSGTLNVTLQAGETLQAQFKGNTSIYQDYNHSRYSYVSFQVSTATVDTGSLLAMRGELEQWGFLKGIMNMFNLITIPDSSDPEHIIIEPYKDIFLPSLTSSANFFDDNSKQLDWTEKIDVSQIKLKPLTDLNKTTLLKFEEDDDDYAFSVYKNSVQGHLYGSCIYDASGLTILEGEEEISADPFAATVIKPLMTQYQDFIIPSIYSYDVQDGTSEGFDNAPRIMYNNEEKTLGSCTPYVPAQNAGGAYNFTSYLQFSHLTSIPTDNTTVDFCFSSYAGLIQPAGGAPVNNLFNNYWLPYLAELYNPDTRIMTLKVNLNSADVSSFNMYDNVFIKNRVFRVNKIDYKPGDLSTVEFILIP